MKKCGLKKCGLYCSHIAKEEVCVVSVELAVYPTTQESEEFEPQVKKHKWYTMPR